MKKKLYILFLLILDCFVFAQEQNIDNSFYNDLQEELADIITERFLLKEGADLSQSEKHLKYIEKMAKRQVRKRVFNEAKNQVKNKVYKRDKKLLLQGLHDKVFIYKVPKWDFASKPFMQKSILHVDVDFDCVDKSFYYGGESQDLSNLLFRQNDLQVKDILLASRLLKNDLVAWRVDRHGAPDPQYNKLHYLHILADQPLDFDASYNKQTINLDFAHHLLEGSLTVGFKLPLVNRHNKIRFNSEISVDDRERLRLAHYQPEELCGVGAPAAPNFFEKYGDLRTFFIDILNKKEIDFNEKDSELGLGDISLFLNFEIEWKESERFFTGINFVLPTSQSRDTSKLCVPELGNGGFYYVEPFVSILFSESRWFNPHAYLDFSIGLPSQVDRRVPKFISYDGIEPASGSKVTSLMIFGSELYVRGNDGVFANEVDAKSKRFADEVVKVSIVPGPKMFLRIGNMFERFLDRRGFFDVYYDFGVKTKDYTRGWLDSSKYDQSILTNNTWSFKHRVGINYTFQIDENFRFNLGSLYTFAGRNVEELFRLNCGLSFEF